MKTQSPLPYEISMILTEKNEARFAYTDRMMAREHFEQLKATMCCGGLAIKTIEFHDHSLQNTRKPK